MGSFDKTISELRETMAQATESLAGIERGDRQFMNDEETTGWWASKYRQIIASCADLIRGYEKQND
jgi:hypothetical protein